MKQYKKYVIPYKSAFILGPIFMIVEVIGEVVLPKLMSMIINYGCGQDPQTAAKGPAYIVGIGVVMVVTALLMMMGGVLGAYFAVKASVNFAGDLSRGEGVVVRHGGDDLVLGQFAHAFLGGDQRGDGLLRDVHCDVLGRLQIDRVEEQPVQGTFQVADGRGKARSQKLDDVLIEILRRESIGLDFHPQDGLRRFEIRLLNREDKTAAEARFQALIDPFQTAGVLVGGDDDLLALGIEGLEDDEEHFHCLGTSDQVLNVVD